MKFKTNLKLLTAGVIFSSFTFAGNQEVDIEDRACLDKGACPKILELAKVGSLKAGKVSSKSLNKNIISTNTISITNKSKKGVTTIIAANNQGKKTSCGQYSLAGKATITVNVSCDVSGSTYTLEDSDGRSNALDITASSTPTPPRKPLYVFVTQSRYSGSLGGYVGANDKCAQNANAGKLDLQDLVWKAWLSADGIDAIDRFTPTELNSRYILPNGDTFTPSLTTLIQSGGPLKQLTIDQNGDTVITSGGIYAWTNTNSDGTTTKFASSLTCNNFTAPNFAQEGSYGEPLNTNGSWTQSSSTDCNTIAQRLYCFQEAP